MDCKHILALTERAQITHSAEYGFEPRYRHLIHQLALRSSAGSALIKQEHCG